MALMPKNRYSSNMPLCLNIIFESVCRSIASVECLYVHAMAIVDAVAVDAVAVGDGCGMCCCLAVTPLVVRCVCACVRVRVCVCEVCLYMVKWRQ